MKYEEDERKRKNGKHFAALAAMTFDPVPEPRRSSNYVKGFKGSLLVKRRVWSDAEKEER